MPRQAVIRYEDILRAEYSGASLSSLGVIVGARQVRRGTERTHVC